MNQNKKENNFLFPKSTVRYISDYFFTFLYSVVILKFVRFKVMFCNNLFLEINYDPQCISIMRDTELNHVNFQSILFAIEDLC